MTPAVPRSARGRLQIQDVEKHYGATAALRGVSLTIEAGEFVALLGPSGCGKTTLLRCICGLTEVGSGDIKIDSESLRAVPPWQRDVSVVFQSYALFPHMTVADNVAFGLRMRRVEQKWIARKIEESLEMGRMSEFASRLPSQLSGGQQQRVALARALAVEPTLVLLDEPLAALDARLRKSVQLEIRQLQARLGITMLLVTHDQSEAMAMADRIAVMNQGRIEQVDTARALYRRPTSPFVAEFVGEMNRIAGVVEGDTPNRAFVAGADVRLALPATSGARRGAATLMVRPEAISVDFAAGRDGKFLHNLTGSIVEALHIGDRVSISVDCSGIGLQVTILNASDRTAEKLTRGRTVHLHWDPEHAIVFNDR